LAESARRYFAVWVALALVAGFNLQPKVEKWTTFSYGLAVEVDTHVSIGRNRPDETLTA